MRFRQSDLHKFLAYFRGIHYLAMEYSGKRYALRTIREEEERSWSNPYYLALYFQESDETLDFYGYNNQKLGEIIKPSDEYSDKKNRDIIVFLLDRRGSIVKEIEYLVLYPKEAFPGNPTTEGKVYQDGHLNVCPIK